MSDGTASSLTAAGTRTARRAGLVGGCVRAERAGAEPARGVDACRWCGDERLIVVRLRGEHRVLRCWRCGFLTIRTGLDEARLADTYQDYLPVDPAEVARWEREQRPVIRRAVLALGKLAPGRRLLEVGSGFGFFLAAARAAGFDARGLEPSATGRQHARERLGLELDPRTLEHAGIPSASFDVVCAFYVIEHLPDPKAFLREAARVLAPGGLLFLRWPHTTPIARLLDAVSIDHDLYHAPWHLSDFTPETMERALIESGFERVKTRTLGGTAPGGLATLLSRGSAAISGALEALTRGRAHLPGVSKTSFGFRVRDVPSFARGAAARAAAREAG